MTRAFLSAVVLLLLTTSASPEANCVGPYVNFLERIGLRAEAMSGDKLAAIHRRALRIFDACDCGHVTDVERRFAELEKLARSES
jgi:hypothetical protein